MCGVLMHGLNMYTFIEMKLEHITPAESAEVLGALATPQDPPITSVQK